MIEVKLQKDQCENVVNIINRSQFNGESAEYIAQLKRVFTEALDESPKVKPEEKK